MNRNRMSDLEINWSTNRNGNAESGHDPGLWWTIRLRGYDTVSPKPDNYIKQTTNLNCEYAEKHRSNSLTIIYYTKTIFRYQLG